MKGETPICFPCEEETLFGVLALPDAAAALGVVIVVGGPQYRVGSHRQFRLLASELTDKGVACLRFDTRGMGDSSGDFPGFDDLNADIRAAVDAFMARVPSLRGVVLWGLCDGASAAAFYAPTDARVSGLVLLNPWIRTEAGEAQAILKHYYLHRLADRNFWAKVLGGGFNPAKSLASLLQTIAKGRTAGSTDAQSQSLPDRVARGLESFGGRVLLVLSGQDLVAREFEDAARQHGALMGALERCRVERHRIDEATHTFSSAKWRAEAARVTSTWVAGEPGEQPATG